MYVYDQELYNEGARALGLKAVDLFGSLTSVTQPTILISTGARFLTMTHWNSTTRNFDNNSLFYPSSSPEPTLSTSINMT